MHAFLCSRFVSPLCTTLGVPCLMLGCLLMQNKPHPPPAPDCAVVVCDPRHDPTLVLATPSAARDTFHIILARNQYRAYLRACRSVELAPTCTARCYRLRGVRYDVYAYRIARLEITPEGARRARLPVL